VKEGIVNGWDDPRMPTLRGLRRRGYTPESIRDFVARAGVAKNINARAGVRVEFALLEACIREELNRTSPRRMVVLDPLKVVIDNYPEHQVEYFEAANNPEDPSAGTRKVPFSKVLYIEQADFQEVPPPKFFRLSPGREVRLRNAYFLTCQSVLKDSQGEIVELHCTIDPATRGGDAPDGRKVKATLHWVSAAHALQAEARLYDRLFNNPDPEVSGDFTQDINPSSLTVLPACWVEPSLADAAPLEKYQFERLGYFCVDLDSAPGKLVFNRTVGLRDEWAKISGAQRQK
jgi:glutaminyl-tRNA synthetase